RVPRDIVRGLERAEGARALGVRLAFDGLFPVEVRQLLDEVHVVQQDRTVGPDRQGVAVARRGRAGARRRTGVRVAMLVGHGVSPVCGRMDARAQLKTMPPSTTIDWPVM